MATMNVADFAGTSTAVEKPLTPGQAVMASSRPVVIASNQSAVPVSGTVTANAGTGTMTVNGAVTQSGTWTVQPGNTPNTTAWKVDGSAVTQPVSGTVTVNGIATTAYDRGAGATTAQTTRVTLASEQIETGKYKAFPNTASTTTTLNGSGSGATGDFLSTVTIVPETLNPGSISIKDGSGSAIVIFAGGTASVLSLVPFTVNLGYTSGSGAWQIVTGSGGNVHGVCGGNFT